MNTKKKLIKELEKDAWNIDTYNDFNRVKILFSFLSILDKVWHDDIEICDMFPFFDTRFIQCEEEITSSSVNNSNYKDLTRIFNEYLEECEPNVWLHSVLAARECGIKVEIKVQDDWGKFDVFSCLNPSYKYRINHNNAATEKLVPDEIWDILDDKVIAIIKNQNQSIVYFYEIPKIVQDSRWAVEKIKIGTDGYGNELSIFSYDYGNCLNLKTMKEAKICDVDWKDSLCIRPSK